MEQTDMTERLQTAEGLLVQGQSEQALELLRKLAEDCEE